jgi:hypothetical protein
VPFPKSDSLNLEFPDRTKFMPAPPSFELKFEIAHVLFIDIVGYSKGSTSSHDSKTH